jgi:hypothetical protein
MDGTILFIKRAGEIAVLLANSPAVLSLRDFAYATTTNNAVVPQLQPKEGSRVVVHDVGSWNVKTSVFHGARMSPHTVQDGTVYPESVSPVPMQAILVADPPPRRKRRLTMTL